MYHRRERELSHLAWAASSDLLGQLFKPATYVNWCGHRQEVIPFPLADGSMRFVPVVGAARWPAERCERRTSRLARCTRCPGRHPVPHTVGVRVQRPPKRRGFLAWGRKTITTLTLLLACARRPTCGVRTNCAVTGFISGRQEVVRSSRHNSREGRPRLAFQAWHAPCCGLARGRWDRSASLWSTTKTSSVSCWPRFWLMKVTRSIPLATVLR